MTYKTFAFIVLAVFVFAGVPASAGATTIRWDFVMTVNAVSDDDGALDGSVVSGSIVTGNVVFDSTQPDINSSTDYGEYRFHGAAGGVASIFATVGNYEFNVVATLADEITILVGTPSNASDMILLASAGGTFTSFTDPLFASSVGGFGGMVYNTAGLGLGSTLGSTSLLITPPGPLAGLGPEGGLFGLATASGSYPTIFFEWDSLSVAPLPIPATLPLFASGLGALGLLGWRRKWKVAALSA